MVKQAKKKSNRAKKAVMPIIGIVLALVFAFFAYLLTPGLEEYILDQGISLEKIEPALRPLIIGGVIWLILFSVAMFFVSLLVGRDFDEDQALKFKREAVKRRKMMERERELKRERRRRMNRGG
jgi:hypothetical protein